MTFSLPAIGAAVAIAVLAGTRVVLDGRDPVPAERIEKETPNPWQDPVLPVATFGYVADDVPVPDWRPTKQFFPATRVRVPEKPLVRRTMRVRCRSPG